MLKINTLKSAPIPLLSYDENEGFKERPISHDDGSLVYWLFENNEFSFILKWNGNGWIISDNNSCKHLTTKSELISEYILLKNNVYDRYDSINTSSKEYNILFETREDAILAFMKYWNWFIKWGK